MLIVHADTDDIENPLHGGQPVRTYEVNSRLSPRHEITVLTATYPGCAKRIVRSGVKYRRLGFGVPGLGLSPHLSYLAALGHTIKRMPHDLIVEEFMPPFGFCLLPLWTNKPIVSIVQWFFFRDWERRYKLPFERAMRAIPRYLNYRHFIVQTATMGDYFKELIPTARIWKIPCGIEDEFFSSPASSAVGDYALFLGRLDVHHKGLDYLIDTWARLRSSGQLIPLRIAGSGPGSEYLQRRIAELDLAGVIQLHGQVEGPAKQAMLRQCRFIVMPSRQETFGLVALEAMAVGKPVVAFDIVHLNELLDPRWASLVPLGAVEQFAAEVSAIWQNPERCRALGTRAYQEAQQYRWNKLASIQESLYSDLVSARVA